MKKVIIVNDVAASSGGALNILKQFLNEISNNIKAKKYEWYIFVSNNLVDNYNCDHVKIVKVDVKLWPKRIIWDTFGIKNWLKKNDLDPIYAISLMSVGFKYLKIKQIVYIAQSLPFDDFNSFKWFEIKPILYKFFIFIWMKWTINKQSKIIVQTNWLKVAVANKLDIEKKNISVIRPEIKLFNLASSNNNKLDLTFEYKLFYPSTPTVSYKNYDILFNSLSLIRKSNPELSNQLKLVLTCSDNDKSKLVKYYLKKSQKLGLENNIIWVGYLNELEMQEQYFSCDAVVFPSLTESFGLPLIEASVLGKKIFVQDKPYARDVLKNYSGVSFIRNNELLWAKEINDFYSTLPLTFRPLVQKKGEWSKFIEFAFEAKKFK